MFSRSHREEKLLISKRPCNFLSITKTQLMKCQSVSLYVILLLPFLNDFSTKGAMSCNHINAFLVRVKQESSLGVKICFFVRVKQDMFLVRVKQESSLGVKICFFVVLTLYFICV